MVGGYGGWGVGGGLLQNSDSPESKNDLHHLELDFQELVLLDLELGLGLVNCIDLHKQFCFVHLMIGINVVIYFKKLLTFMAMLKAIQPFLSDVPKGALYRPKQIEYE